MLFKKRKHKVKKYEKEIVYLLDKLNRLTCSNEYRDLSFTQKLDIVLIEHENENQKLNSKKITKLVNLLKEKKMLLN